MSADDFDPFIERLYSRTPVMQDAGLFAADVETRLASASRIRTLALTAAGLIGGGMFFALGEEKGGPDRLDPAGPGLHGRDAIVLDHRGGPAGPAGGRSGEVVPGGLSVQPEAGDGSSDLRARHRGAQGSGADRLPHGL